MIDSLTRILPGVTGKRDAHERLPELIAAAVRVFTREGYRLARMSDVAAEMGLSEPGLDRLIHSAYRLLDLITYFTAGVQEVRAWTIRRGTKAPGAAGVIHSDFERGFIKADCYSCDDLFALGATSLGVVRAAHAARDQTAAR